MDRTERFYLIDRLFKARGAMPIAALMEELGVSRATALRDLTYMRERLNVPIAFDRSLGAIVSMPPQVVMPSQGFGLMPARSMRC